MPVHNADIARVFEEIADLLEIQDANPFRVRAYRNAARSVGNLALDLAAAVREGRPLPKIPGIGEDLAAKIAEIARTGTTTLLERLRRQSAPAVTELLRLPGLGPKRVRALVERLGVKSLADLEQAARAGKVRALPGFGEKTEAAIARAAAERLGAAKRFQLATAAQYADALVAHLARARGVKHVVAAGSLRRRRETVGDVDIVAAGATEDAMRRFVGYSEVAEVLAQGPTRASVRLKSGLQVDLRAVPEESYGAALAYFTGSKAHNIALRRLAQARGLKINEYGVWRGRHRIAGATEESVYEAVGLPWIPPELREDRGEIEAAKAGRLPRLIERSDLRGDLHAHTRWTDGANSVAEMAQAARAARASVFSPAALIASSIGATLAAPISGTLIAEYASTTCSNRSRARFSRARRSACASPFAEVALPSTGTRMRRNAMLSSPGVRSPRAIVAGHPELCRSGRTRRSSAAPRPGRGARSARCA